MPDQLTVNKNALRPFSPRPLRLATGLNFLELILEKIFAPLQQRGTASVADLDMVPQCALEPTQPARPGHRTYLAHHFQRLHPLVRLSHVLRPTESMIQRLWRNGGHVDIQALGAACVHVRGGMRRSKGDSLRINVTCFMRHVSLAASMPSGVGECKLRHDHIGQVWLQGN